MPVKFRNIWGAINEEQVDHSLPEHHLLVAVIKCAIQDFAIRKVTKDADVNEYWAAQYLLSDASENAMMSFRWALSFLVDDVEGARNRILKTCDLIRRSKVKDHLEIVFKCGIFFVRRKTMQKR